MKVFKFPTWSTYQKQNKAPYRPEQKYLIIRDPKKPSKYSLEKKAASLDSKKFEQKKRMQLEMVYSADKKKRSRSNSNTTNCYFNSSPQRRTFQSKMLSNSKKDYIPEKKLYLRSDSKSKIIFNEMSVFAEAFSKKLRSSNNFQSQKLFLQNYQESCDWLKDVEKESEKNESYTILKELVQNLIACEERKKQISLNVFYDSISRLQKQKSHLNLENKRLKIKFEASEQQVSKFQEKNNELAKEIVKLKEGNKKNMKDYAIQTKQSGNIEYNFENTNEELKNPEEKKTMVKMIKEIREMKERERQITILLNQLRKQGVDLSMMYVKGMRSFQKDKKKQAKSNNSSGVSSEEEDETSYNEFLDKKDNDFFQNLTKQEAIYLEEAKKRNQKRKNKKNNLQTKKSKETTDYDADDSIIDDIEALSFNYEDKEQSMDGYTPRRVYECKKPLGEQMKKKLALNFEVLYEDQSDYSRNEAFPTI